MLPTHLLQHGPWETGRTDSTLFPDKLDVLPVRRHISPDIITGQAICRKFMFGSVRESEATNQFQENKELELRRSNETF